MTLPARRRVLSAPNADAPTEWRLGDAVRRPATAAAGFGAAFVALVVAVVIDASSGSGVSPVAVISLAVCAGLVGAAWAATTWATPEGLAAPVRRLFVLATISYAVFALVYLLAQRTTYGQEFEREALLGSGTDLSPFANDAQSILDQLAVGTVVLVGAALCSLAAVRGGLPFASAVGGGIVLTSLSAVAWKELLLERPVLLGDAAVATARSYPSGHVAAFAALGAATIVIAPPRWRLGATLAAIASSAIVSTAVLYVGWHRPSDAIGGMALAVGWFSVVAAVVARLEARTLAPGPGPLRSVPRRLWYLGAYVLAFGASIYALAELARLHAAVDDSPDHTLAFAGGVLVCIAVAVIAFTGLAAALPNRGDLASEPEAPGASMGSGVSDESSATPT